MRAFQLVRDVDVTGVSGTGIVADGVVFDDGRCVMLWRGEHRSLVAWDSVTSLERIHGHDGATRIVYVTISGTEGTDDQEASGAT